MPDWRPLSSYGPSLNLYLSPPIPDGNGRFRWGLGSRRQRNRSDHDHSPTPDWDSQPQREDEVLWGQKKRSSDKADYYIPRMPPVNDLHPPVASGPKSRAEVRWMLQPPPSAKVMEGKESPNRFPPPPPSRMRRRENFRANRYVRDLPEVVVEPESERLRGLSLSSDHLQLEQELLRNPVPAAPRSDGYVSRCTVRALPITVPPHPDFSDVLQEPVKCSSAKADHLTTTRLEEGHHISISTFPMERRPTSCKREVLDFCELIHPFSPDSVTNLSGTSPRNSTASKDTTIEMQMLQLQIDQRDVDPSLEELFESVCPPYYRWSIDF